MNIGKVFAVRLGPLWGLGGERYVIFREWALSPSVLVCVRPGRCVVS